MNIKEYIESGVLEAYILGALSPEEVYLVETTLVKYPELRDELIAIENSMQQFSATQSKEPPSGLEDKIWSSIQQQGSAAPAPAVSHAPKTIPFTPEYHKPAQWKFAAMWAALLVSLAGNAYLFSDSSSNSEARKALAAHLDEIESEQKLLAATIGDYQKVKHMMADTAMQTIVMHTVQKGHPMAATLYWSKEKGEAYVSVDGLPEPPKGMQYQLWAMQGGKPVSMGVLPNSMANTPAVQKVGMQVTSGEAFAISLEKAGGSPSPNMDQIYVMGKV